MNRTSEFYNKPSGMSAYPLYGRSFYSAPSGMAGGYIIYGGYRRQRGAGMFGSFRNYIAPAGKHIVSGLGKATLDAIGKTAMDGVKQASKSDIVRDIAKKAGETGAQVLSGVALDALQGKNVGESVQRRSKEMLMNKLNSLGAPLRRPPAKKAKKKLKQRKRRALSSSPPQKQGPPPAKKRRQQRSISRAALNRKELF